MICSTEQIYFQPKEFFAINKRPVSNVTKKVKKLFENILKQIVQILNYIDVDYFIDLK